MLSMEHNDIPDPGGTGHADGRADARVLDFRRACRTSSSPDAAPTRIKLLGEKLIAFRDTEGPHRHPGSPLPAPLRLDVLRPATRKAGIRCALSRLEVRRRRQLPRPAEICPEDQPLHRSRQGQGLQGRREGRHRLGIHGQGGRCRRRFRPSRCSASPDDERIVMCHMRDCNWLQSLERRHRHLAFRLPAMPAPCSPTTSTPTTMHRYGLLNRTPALPRQGRPSGARCTMPTVPADSGNYFPPLRALHVPVLRAGARRQPSANMIQATLSVPLDDNHTMTYVCAWSKRDIALRTLKDGSPIPGAAVTRDFLPTTTDWLGRWRLKANRDNDYLIDRDEQAERQVVFRHPGHRPTGPGDGREHGGRGGKASSIEVSRTLPASDRMIAITRRRIIAAAQGAPKRRHDPADRRSARVDGANARRRLVRMLRQGRLARRLRRGAAPRAQSPAGFLLQAAE